MLMDIGRYLPIVYPQAILLGLVLAWFYAKRLRNHNLWRLGALIAAILLLCYPVARRVSKAFDLYVLVDRSRSISAEGVAKQVELLDLVGRRLDPVARAPRSLLLRRLGSRRRSRRWRPRLGQL